MKELILRIIVTVLATFAAFAMTGCSDRTGGTIDQVPEQPVSGESNLLIAYFSCSEIRRRLQIIFRKKREGSFTGY